MNPIGQNLRTWCVLICSCIIGAGLHTMLEETRVSAFSVQFRIRVSLSLNSSKCCSAWKENEGDGIGGRESFRVMVETISQCLPS